MILTVPRNEDSHYGHGFPGISPFPNRKLHPFPAMTIIHDGSYGVSHRRPGCMRGFCRVHHAIGDCCCHHKITRRMLAVHQIPGRRDYPPAIWERDRKDAQQILYRSPAHVGELHCLLAEDRRYCPDDTHQGQTGISSACRSEQHLLQLYRKQGCPVLAPGRSHLPEPGALLRSFFSQLFPYTGFRRPQLSPGNRCG
jgi:hypothetical protein